MYRLMSAPICSVFFSFLLLFFFFVRGRGTVRTNGVGSWFIDGGDFNIYTDRKKIRNVVHTSHCTLTTFFVLVNA